MILNKVNDSLLRAKMKQHYIYLVGLFLVLLLVSCESKEERPQPANLLSENEMTDVLTEICKVEARFQRRLSIKNTTNAELVFHNYQVVFEQYDISIEEFKTSYQYYQESPQDMQNIYDSVIVKLTKQEAIYKSTIKEPEIE